MTRPRPDRRVLAGELVRLEPFDVAKHERPLYESLHDSAGDPHLRDHPPDGVPLGQASCLRIEPEHRVIEIGHIALGPALQRTPAATEAMFLLARHAFDDLGYRRLEWKTDALNARSRRAAERLGFTFEGIF